MATDNRLLDEIRASVKAAMDRYAVPVENDLRDCSYPVWFPRNGCRGRVTHEVNNRPYCAEHARIKAIYANQKR